MRLPSAWCGLLLLLVSWMISFECLSNWPGIPRLIGDPALVLVLLLVLVANARWLRGSGFATSGRAGFLVDPLFMAFGALLMSMLIGGAAYLGLIVV